MSDIHAAGWCGFKPSDYGKEVTTWEEVAGSPTIFLDVCEFLRSIAWAVTG